MAKTDQSLRQDYLYTVIKKMRVKGMIADLIHEEWFGGYFDVHMADGKLYKAFYTPFYAEVFVKDVSELEALKKGRLRYIVKVEPQYNVEVL
jgi:hypothetical protein